MAQNGWTVPLKVPSNPFRSGAVPRKIPAGTAMGTFPVRIGTVFYTSAFQ
jgi:hypothetical protein